MKKYAILIILILIYASPICYSAGGLSSFEFMLLGPGSRASGMGEAFTALGGDAGAPYFNPASGCFIDRTEFQLTHLIYLQDFTMDQFSVASKLGEYHYGINLQLGKISDFARRSDYPSAEPLGYFSEHNFVASFLASYPVSPEILIGGAFKYAYEKLDLESAGAIAFDLGSIYKLTPEINVGLSIRNLGTKPKFANIAYDLPRELRVGVSYTVLNNSAFNGSSVAADVVFPKWGNGKTKLDIGAEYDYTNMFFARAGYQFGYDSKSFSIGGGINYQKFSFDYSFVPFSNELSNSHRFSLRAKL